MSEFIDYLWHFVRGDIEDSEFEHWAYNSSELEEQLDPETYLNVVSVNFSNAGDIFVLKEKLREFAESTKHYDCRCITIPNLGDVGMGEHDHIFNSFENQKRYGEKYWWLSIYKCRECNQNWMVAQEERINDVFLLRRVSEEIAKDIRTLDIWPDEFKTFSSLLRIGRERGHNCRFVNPLSRSLLHTVEDLAVEKPGISVSEISYLLEISDEWAYDLCQQVLSKNDFAINLEFDASHPD